MTTERVDPPLAADETATLMGCLDHQRATLRRKVDGLDADQLQATLAPSTTTLGGMVKHHIAAGADLAALSALLDREVAASDEVVPEYARHNGHADLLREAIDGTVGE